MSSLFVLEMIGEGIEEKQLFEILKGYGYREENIKKNLEILRRSGLIEYRDRTIRPTYKGSCLIKM